jgi:hypothetical protein
MRSASRLVLALSCVVLAAACTGSASPSTAGGAGGTAPSNAGVAGGPAPSNPCSLLTQAEVSQAVGQAVGPGDNSTDSHECEFQYPPNDVPQVQASITIESETKVDDLCVPGDGYTVTPLSGVGDAACFVDVPGLSSGDNLPFAHAGHVYTVAASFGSKGTKDQILAADRALALAALTHLP